jgi:3-isopropylmalate dehydrogenase
MTATRTHRIAAIPGDGIGEEVVREGLRALDTAGELFGFRAETETFPFGADHYLATGETLPKSFLDGIEKRFDQILLGAIGDPRVETGLLERAIVGGIRWELDLYVNLRPVRLYAEHLCPLKGKRPEDVDLVVVRENTEDAYRGPVEFKEKGTPNEVATSVMLYTRKGVERCVRYAYALCRERGRRKRLTLVDKANAVRAHDLWTRVFAEVGREYPDVEQDHAYVDAACMWLVKNPEHFDVVVTTNMFGDILTDLAAMIQGGLGIAAGANLHPGRVSMFEPIHGSAPKYRGRNKANPLATICTVALMLEALGEKPAAAAIEATVSELLRSKRIPTLSAAEGLGTREIGALVCETLARRGASSG